jgi:uncharacterized protein YgiM (DUF1202 family)
MSDRNTADNWRLEESGDTTGRWKLEEAEQNQISPWELQDEYAEENEWQPVDYAREPRPQGGGWVLPSLVGLALIAVVAYGAWIGLTRLQPGMLGQLLGQNTLLTPVPTVDSAAAAITPEQPVTEEGAAEEPTATATPEALVAPTAAPTVPAAPALVEERFVTISAQYGVNARPNPSTEGDALQILEQGQEYLVVDETAEWLQVALPTGQLAWISSDPEFVTVRAEEMEVTRANQFRAQVQAPLLEGGVATEEPVGTAPSTTAVTATVPATETAGIVVPTTEPVAEALVGAAISGRVNITGGLNARAQPDTTGELIALLPNDTLLTLTGRTADSAWVRSTLSDSITIWVFAEFVEVTGELSALPVIDDSGASGATPITGTITTVESTPEAPAAAPPGESTSSATAAVNTILGAAVRAGPAATEDAIATAIYENVLTVTGRSADNLWLQVDLGDQQGWVLVSAVDLSVELASLPVVNP